MDASTQPISPLRRRFIDDMTVLKLDPKTQANYLRSVKRFADFLGRSPAGASAEDLRRFQLQLVACGTGTPTCNATLTALRFFFEVTVDRPEVTAKARGVREPRRLPVVLSPEEVTRLLAAEPGRPPWGATQPVAPPGRRGRGLTSVSVRPGCRVYSPLVGQDAGGNMRCQQCGYERFSWEAGPADICPKCGAKYEKADTRLFTRKADETLPRPIGKGLKAKGAGPPTHREGSRRPPTASSDERLGPLHFALLALGAIAAVFLLVYAVYTDAPVAPPDPAASRANTVCRAASEAGAHGCSVDVRRKLIDIRLNSDRSEAEKICYGMARILREDGLSLPGWSAQIRVGNYDDFPVTCDL